jgi:hypothetical protein
MTAQPQRDHIRFYPNLAHMYSHLRFTINAWHNPQGTQATRYTPLYEVWSASHCEGITAELHSRLQACGLAHPPFC